MLYIPKLFHRIWLGDKPMPQEFVDFGRTWRSLHPGWTMLEWNRPEQLAPLYNREILSKAKNVAQLSDILRYEILTAVGGVYLDTDFECLKNIEPLLENAQFVGAGEYELMVSAGFIACVPRHVIVNKARQRIPGRIDSPQHQAHTTGPGLLTDVWRDHQHDEGVVTYGPKLFYPYGWKEKHRRHEAFPEAYAVHHWAGSWL